MLQNEIRNIYYYTILLYVSNILAIYTSAHIYHIAYLLLFIKVNKYNIFEQI